MRSKIFMATLLLFSCFMFSASFLNANANKNLVNDSACPTCCPFFDFECTSQPIGNGCELYKIRGFNDSRCPIYLYDADGNQLASFPTGPIPTVVEIQICNGIDGFSFGTSCEKCILFTC